LLIIPLLLAGCGSEKITLPAPDRIERIDVCAGKNGCSVAKHSISDPAAIAEVVKAAAAHRSGWQTEKAMALATGWLTYPTPEDSASIRDRQGMTPVVLWFGPGWMGSAVTDDDGRKRYFRKVPENQVTELRAALGIASGSNRPPSAAAERKR
jgi:hypothetical protein